MVSTRPLQRPAWLPAEVWPFETQALDVNGFVVAVSDIGDGPPLLFYTGIGSFVWRDVMTSLSNGFRCIAVDPPGIGLSEPIAPSAATIRNSARALAAVIDAFDLRALTLVVHDTGGPPAFAAAASMSERIQGLVALNTFGWRPSGAAFRSMLALMGSGVARRFSLASGALAVLMATAFGAGRQLNAASRRAYRAGFQASMNVFHDYLRDARDSDVYADIRRGFSGRLADVPLLTIFGERNDPLHFQPRWRQLFPVARQLVIPKGNHFPMCDDPGLVAAEIRRWHRDHVGRRQERRA